MGRDRGKMIHQGWYWITIEPDEAPQVAQYVEVDGRAGFWVAGCDCLYRFGAVADVGAMVGLSPDDMMERWRGLVRSKVQMDLATGGSSDPYPYVPLDLEARRGG